MAPYNVPITPKFLFDTISWFLEKPKSNKIKYFLEKAFSENIDINIQSECKKYTLLHYSISFNFPEIVEFLLEKGANPNISSKSGETPLCLIAKNYFFDQNDFNLSKLLIQKGSDVELKDLDGHSPIFFATLRGNAEMVKLLIQYGADINFIVPVSNYFYEGASLVENQYWKVNQD